MTALGSLNPRLCSSLVCVVIQGICRARCNQSSFMHSMLQVPNCQPFGVQPRCCSLMHSKLQVRRGQPFRVAAELLQLVAARLYFRAPATKLNLNQPSTALDQLRNEDQQQHGLDAFHSPLWEIRELITQAVFLTRRPPLSQAMGCAVGQARPRDRLQQHARLDRLAPCAVRVGGA